MGSSFVGVGEGGASAWGWLTISPLPCSGKFDLLCLTRLLETKHLFISRHYVYARVIWGRFSGAQSL